MSEVSSVGGAPLKFYQSTTAGLRIRIRFYSFYYISIFRKACRMTIEDLRQAREKLKTSDARTGLPGREDKINELETFLHERLKVRQTTDQKRAKVEAGLVANIKDRHSNKTVFVCGVPGTGKTAVVLNVVERLHKELKKKNCQLHKFEYVYVNGQQITSPEKIYSEILYKLSGSDTNPEKAQAILDAVFLPDGQEQVAVSRATKRRIDTFSFKVIIIDELDLLYNEKRLNVFYNLFDWPTSNNSKIILITIANAMDLPERFMRGRISSRIGWNKIVFEPYTSNHLESILTARLGPSLLAKCFDKAAILIATKRIGKTTGDARRILDTCCLAVDEAISSNQSKVTAKIVDQVGFQNLDRMKSNYVESCTPIEKCILKGIINVTANEGETNVKASGVYNQVNQMLLLSSHPWLKEKILGYEEFHMYLNMLLGVGLICLEGCSKTLLEKHLYIKDTSESFKDVIRSTKIDIG